MSCCQSTRELIAILVHTIFAPTQQHHLVLVLVLCDRHTYLVNSMHTTAGPVTALATQVTYVYPHSPPDLNRNESLVDVCLILQAPQPSWVD